MTRAVMVTQGCRGREAGVKGAKQGDDDQQHISLVTLLLAAIRRSVVPCRIHRSDGVVAALRQMEIGWPTNVCHVSHVTFDRFDGFLGLPVEFELEIPGRVPSASANVFGVSAELMQCSYDSKGNSVPTILLLMQDRLYSQGGLKAEGIFRINPENSQEECVRDQLNEGIVPDDIDVHCLAGLIKAWFRELPSGVLDGLSPEQVLQCNTEEESVELVALLLPTQAALLNWAVELMSDVVEEVDFNKMNARNIAMVFAPNMTQMADPLTALMHTVQVMNLLKTLILKTIRERKEIVIGFSSPSSGERTDDDFDSQIEDVGFELIETTSEDEHFDYTHYTRDESESKNAIVECFSRQLDGRKELTNDVEHEELVENLGRDQERIWGSSDSITKSAFSISDSKNGSSISSSIMNEGEDLVTSVTMESESRQLTDSLVS